MALSPQTIEKAL